MIDMDIEIIECDQGTPEWFEARAGVISASMFSTIRKKVNGLNEKQALYVKAVQEGKTDTEALEASGFKSAPRAQVVADAIEGKPVGDYSDAAKNYAFNLAVERICGGPALEDKYRTKYMDRGNDLEESCRQRHEADIEVITDLAGFVRTTDMKFGCSADSLVDGDGGGEYKCFLGADSLRPIIIHGDWGDVMDQVQGCMWLTGRKWWDMCLYCPPLKNAGKDFIRKRVERDDNYIEALEQDLIEFDQLVEKYVAEIMGKMESAPEPELEVNW